MNGAARLSCKSVNEGASGHTCTELGGGSRVTHLGRISVKKWNWVSLSNGSALIGQILCFEEDLKRRSSI